MDTSKLPTNNQLSTDTNVPKSPVQNKGRRKMDIKLYQRPDSKYYWMKWYYQGLLKRQSTKTSNRESAKLIAKKKELDFIKGIGIETHRLTFRDLIQEVIDDYNLNNKRSMKRLNGSIKHLRGFFSGKKIQDISEVDISNYKKQRNKEGAANATINRELAALRRGFNLLKEKKQIYNMPFIKLLSEDNIRTNFFEKWEFHALLEKLPAYLKPVVIFAYRSGWRREEILDLTWKQVDLITDIITIPPGYAKNKKGRKFFLDEEIYLIIKLLRDVRELKMSIDENYNPPDYVFLNKLGMDKIRDFRGAWKTACKEAKIGKKYFHDFRRTAARNLIRSKTPEKVAMSITGHLTRSTFDRYNIVSEEDLKMASNNLSEYLKKEDLIVSPHAAKFAKAREKLKKERDKEAEELEKMLKQSLQKKNGKRDN